MCKYIQSFLPTGLNTVEFDQTTVSNHHLLKQLYVFEGLTLEFPVHLQSSLKNVWSLGTTTPWNSRIGMDSSNG